MSRATHYLRASRHVGYPKRQAAVTVRYGRITDERCPGIAADVLLAWRACSWRGPPGEEVWLSEGEGVTEGTFWRWLAGQRARREQLWVWMPAAVHCLTLLGFWSRITEGEYVLSRRDAKETGDNDPDGAGASGGLCVCEDPPTIIVAMQPHATGSIRLLDIRNLGISGASAIGCDPADPRGLATWLQAWARTVEELELGGLRCTAAAQAWHGWRHHYLQCGVLIHGDSQICDMERDSIYPGRAEAFRLGDVGGGAVALDASAYYPACAVAGTLPCRCKWRGDCDLPALCRATDRGWLAIATCRVRCREPILPCRIDAHGRPVPPRGYGPLGDARSAATDRTVWPVGEWVGTYAGPELDLAARMGAVVSVVRACLYEPDRPLDGFVSALWQARLAAARAGLVAQEQCIKLLTNSLIGKMAAREHSWVDEPLPCPPGAWRTWHSYDDSGALKAKYRTIGWHGQRLVEGGETKESCPALASWIYSVGRVQLWDWMDTAGRREVYYVDSDSLLLSERGRGLLRPLGVGEQPQLGALRVQGVYPSLWVGGIKQYSAPGRTVQAGVAAADEPDGHGGWVGWRTDTIRECVHARHAPRAQARQVTIPVLRAYRHGTVDAQGRVSPLEV